MFLPIYYLCFLICTYLISIMNRPILCSFTGSHMHGLSRTSWLHSHVWVMGSWGFGIIVWSENNYFLCLGLWSYSHVKMRMARAVMEVFPHGWVLLWSGINCFPMLRYMNIIIGSLVTVICGPWPMFRFMNRAFDLFCVGPSRDERNMCPFSLDMLLSPLLLYTDHSWLRVCLFAIA